MYNLKKDCFMLDDIKNSTDLANLKERINNCSDEELAAAMEEEWLHRSEERR